MGGGIVFKKEKRFTTKVAENLISEILSLIRKNSRKSWIIVLRFAVAHCKNPFWGNIRIIRILSMAVLPFK